MERQLSLSITALSGDASLFVSMPDSQCAPPPVRTVGRRSATQVCVVIERYKQSFCQSPVLVWNISKMREQAGLDVDKICVAIDLAATSANHRAIPGRIENQSIQL